MMVFFDNWHNMLLAAAELRASSQFTRKGPQRALLSGVPVEPPLVTAVALNSMREAPQVIPHFNQTDYL